MSDFVWGTVTAVSPFRVRLDGDTAELPFSSDSLVTAQSLVIADRVRVELSGTRVIVHGRNGGDGALFSALDSRIASLPLAYENLVINGDFRVNQRVAASGASLASGAYFVDRWKSGSASNAVTWTGDDAAGRVLTVPSSKTIQQVIERTNIPSGDYTFTHDGTAQLRVYNVGGTPPSLAAGPVTVTLDGSADVVIEFGAGTVSKVRGYVGTSAYPFVPRKIGDELLLCYRYHYRLNGTGNGAHLMVGFQISTTGADVYGSLPVPMRALPTLARNTIGFSDDVAFNVTLTSLALADTGNTTMTDRVALRAAWSGNQGATYRPGSLVVFNGSSGWVAFDAEL